MKHTLITMNMLAILHIYPTVYTQINKYIKNSYSAVKLLSRIMDPFIHMIEGGGNPDTGHWNSTVLPSSTAIEWTTSLSRLGGTITSSLIIANKCNMKLFLN